MSLLQILVIVITIGLNAMDGFDVLSISFASPGIAKEWGIDRAVLGIVLSMELIGMALGSIALGGVADKIGRRPTMLGCLVTMGVGMLMATTAGTVFQLSIWRVLTGLGIGGLLASITAITAEFSNLKRRHLCISIMAIGYPIGGAVGAEIASWLLIDYDWRSIFYFGAAVTAVFIPVFYFMVPESVHWLVRKQPAGALEKVNHTLERMGHLSVAELPEVTVEARKKSIGDLFAPGLVKITTIITVAYFLLITTYYFILKWVPKIVVDMGFSASTGAGMLVYANIGGALGGAIFGLLTLRYDLKKLAIGTLVLASVFVAVLGQTPPDLDHIALFVGMAGFFGNAGIVGMYALFPVAFPTHVRASGTGFAVGVGRGGAIFSPIIAGFMFKWGLPLPTVAVLMSVAAFIAAGVLLFLKIPGGPSGVQPGP